MDYNSPVKEVAELLSDDIDLYLYTNSLSPLFQSNNMKPFMLMMDTLFLRSLDCFGNPYIGAYLIHNMKYGITPKRIIIAAINQARKRQI